MKRKRNPIAITLLMIAISFLTACGSTDLTPLSLTPSISPSPEANATPDMATKHDGAFPVTRQVSQTQVLRVQATWIARQTEVVKTIATSPTRSATRTPTKASEDQEPVFNVSWKETLPLPNPYYPPISNRKGGQLIFHDSYVYIFGGQKLNDYSLTNIYFSSIESGGMLTWWVKTTSLPGENYDYVVVKNGKYLYLITSLGEVYYAFANGPVGEWKSTTSLGFSRWEFAATSYKNFIYVSGGNFEYSQGVVQFTSVKPDGGVKAWAFTSPLPENSRLHTLIAYDGYLYVVGGENVNGEKMNTIYSAAINPDGTLAEWKTTTRIPQRMSSFSAFESDGYIFLLGDTWGYYSRILENHTLESWQPFTPLPAIRYSPWTGAYKGYAYAMSGYDSSGFQNTVYYAWIGHLTEGRPAIVEHLDCTSGWTRLKAGGQAIVSADTTTPNRVRSGPSSAEPQVALLYPGVNFRLIEGPVCADGLIFWRVEHASIPGGVGWTAEGDGRDYFLDPYNP